MTNLKLGDIGDSMPKAFSHNVHVAGLGEKGRAHVGDATRAAIKHVVQRRELQYGIGGEHANEHVAMALQFLDREYDGRHKLGTKERKVIEKSLKDHFGLKDAPAPEPRVEEKDDN